MTPDERSSPPSPGGSQPLKSPVEPTEAQKKVFQAVFMVVAIILAAVAVFLFLGNFFGWLPEWKPWASLSAAPITVL